MYEYFSELYQNFDLFFKSIGFKRKGKIWILENDNYIIIFKLRKHTIRETVFVDYGVLLKFIDLPLAFGELDWHLTGGMGEFDKKLFQMGIKKDDDYKHYFPYILNTVIPEIQRVADIIFNKSNFRLEVYKYVGPCSGKAIRSLEAYLGI